jgi:DNA ligase-1
VLILDPVKNVLITATLWDDVNMNPTGWHMTEKFDGMRLYWNGSQFFTRQGKQVKAPSFITSQMPSVPLDGELWYVTMSHIITSNRTQYGLHQEAVSICLKTADSEKWNKAIFWVFDAPDKANFSFEVTPNKLLVVYIL